MATGVTRMSRNGQVVIPKRIRDKLGLRPGEAIIASDLEGRIVLAPARGEAIRGEFRAITAEFDRLMAGAAPVDAVALVQEVRERKARGRDSGSREGESA